MGKLKRNKRKELIQPITTNYEKTELVEDADLFSDDLHPVDFYSVQTNDFTDVQRDESGNLLYR